MSSSRPSATSRITVIGLLLLGAMVATDTPAPAETIARLAAAERAGNVAAPGPFAVLADGRVAVHVPAAEGILILEGANIVGHLPVPHGLAVDDLTANGDLLVSGAVLSGGRLTIQIGIFDVAKRSLVIRVDSANPFLRMSADSSRGWRVVAGKDRAGVFHPPTAASYPLWDRALGIVPSSEQIGRARAGIGFSGRDRWVPHPDGSIGRRQRGPTEIVLDAGHGTFVGGLDDGTLLMRRDGNDPTTDASLPEVIVLDAFRNGAAIGSIRLRARPIHIPAKRAVFHGRPVQVAGGRIAWAYVGDDGLEIRAIEPRVAQPGND